ncbi:hypothetical protein [Rhodococcus sp. IEGM 1318]|uniref:hypothetical protein n=1 Tax=Rhodococcus sp. IEGM 1318 TaxID=3082226 RepID=UPI0029551028|nr:hypothetical protein [Rhodococcus sp. IEGM 1318]MDV8003386.1 hypothetical protein [Rhodococcus sp. IEGM 1318]
MNECAARISAGTTPGWNDTVMAPPELGKLTKTSTVNTAKIAAKHCGRAMQTLIDQY